MNDELISRKAVLECIGMTSVHSELARKLRQLPTIPTDRDCISRKSVIQLTREMISAEEYGLMDLLDEVKKLPTIPQPKAEGDLISRTALLNAIWQKEYGKDYDGVNSLGVKYVDIIEGLPEVKTEGDLISRKAVLELRKYNLNGGIHTVNVADIENLPTIPQTNLTYDMVEQYAKENGFVIWTKEQTEDTLRKLLNYMDTEKQTDSDLAEFLLAKVKDFESVAIRVKHNTENLDRLIDYIHRVIKNAENGTFTVEKQTDSVLAEIKAEINEIDSMTFVGSGSGCASEMQMECLKIISKHISRKE